MQTDIYTQIKVQASIIEELISELDDKEKILLFERHFNSVVQQDFKNANFPIMKPKIINQ